MRHITRSMDPATLTETERQLHSAITPDDRTLDAWLEIIDYWDEDKKLSLAALQLCVDYGIENPDEYDIGEYLEGQVLDHRLLINSQKNIIRIDLLVACGGPNIWHKISDDGRCTISCAWWGATATGHVEHELYQRVFEYLHEVL